jgi:glycosyltransferase involved in cell wall biosynthesis
MISVFYVLNNRFPTIKAYGLQVAKTCEGMKYAGAQVRLVIPTRARHRELRGLDSLDLYGVKNRFRVIRIPSLDFTRIHLNSMIWFLIQQFFFALFASIALSFRRGVVYSRDPFTLFLLSFVRRNIFWEVHRIPENPRSITYRRLLGACDGIVCITNGIHRKLTELGVPAERLLVSPDGIDLEQFAIAGSAVDTKKKLGLDPEKHNVVYVGQLLEWKGVETLVATAQLLDERFCVTVVGGTSADIKRLRSGDRSGKVHFVPFQPHSRIPLWLHAADTVVLPNKKDAGISEYYTSPLKMFEYMAAARSIVASDLPSIREVLNEGNAILVTPDDPHALRDGIVLSADDVAGSEARIKRALEDARRYSWRKRGISIVQFTQHAISH